MRNKTAVAASVVLMLIVLFALLAPLLATHDPGQIRLAAEFIKQPPSVRHILGTDHLGRDLWSRMLFGARISLTVGFLTMLISVLFGTAYGAVSGYYGGTVDTIMMRVTDILLALPVLFFLIILAAVMEPGIYGIVAVIGLTGWMRVARLVRGEFLTLRELEFVEAARSLGYSNSRIIIMHMLPNTRAAIIVNATLTVAYAILTESALGFLGFGVQPPQFSWGSMLHAAQDIVLLREAPWNAFFPGLAIFVTILSLHFLGDGLRDSLDPKCRQQWVGKR